MKITEYTILNAKSIKALQILVNKWIQEGWQPIGGVWELKQTMVLYEEEEPNYDIQLNTTHFRPHACQCEAI